MVVLFVFKLNFKFGVCMFTQTHLLLCIVDNTEMVSCDMFVLLIMMYFKLKVNIHFVQLRIH